MDFVIKSIGFGKVPFLFVLMGLDRVRCHQNGVHEKPVGVTPPRVGERQHVAWIR